MFRIDTGNNRICPLEAKHFTELGFSERQHLQEWIANFPEALGEELLIIQKEFDGFDDTRERLDLLALDKQGNLVIIENKLDDSGRDVVWQALKYAGYCANLGKSQIVDIYQRYLERAGCTGEETDSAEERISEFMEAAEFDEVILNSGQSQRIMFVAANYRKEVTNTALWLIGHGIPCQCFKATPFASGEDLFLNFEQVIPTPEAADYMIGFAIKEAEEKRTSQTVRGTQGLRETFWQKVLEAFGQSGCRMFDNRSTSKDCWLNTGSGTSGMHYTLVMLRKEIRVEFNIESRDPAWNTRVYEGLLERKAIIESGFGEQLLWYPLPERKACRLKYRKEIDGHDEGNWPEINRWFIEHIAKLESVLRQPLQEISETM